MNKPEVKKLTRPVTLTLPPEYVGTASAGMVLGRAPSGAALVVRVEATHVRCRWPRVRCHCGGQALYEMWRAGLESRERT